ncbi:MAG: iron-sulfur cluster assembly scaffold protein [Candidatus Margulisiibacteriota bacterium]
MDWLYSDILKDHFQHPRNVLVDESSYPDDGKGLVGNPQCGDMMLVVIRVDKVAERITDFKWKTYGCASAVGSTSILSDLVLKDGGLTLEEAWKLQPKDIMDALGGLPHHKIHCSVLGDKALRAAISDYYRRNGQADKIPGTGARVICSCLNVTDQEIMEQVENGVNSFEELQERTKVSTGCGKCREEVKTLFEKYKKEMIGVPHH